MKVDPQVKKDFLHRLYKDKEFLKSCHLMDYSLLMIFLKKHEILDLETAANPNRKHSFYIKREANGDEIEMEEIPDAYVYAPSRMHHHPTAHNLLAP